MRVGLVVRGRVEEGTEDRNAAPVFVELIRRVATRHSVQVFSLHGEHRTSLWSLRRSGASVHRFAGADVFQLGTVRAPRLRLLADVLRVWAAIQAGRSRWGRPQVLHGIGMSASIVATVVARLLGVPSVVSLIGGELTDMPEIDYGYLRTARGRALMSGLLRNAGTLTVASRFMQKRVQRHGVQGRVMPFGIDVRRFLGPVARPDGPPFRLLHVGTLGPVKDQVTLVRALHLLVEEGADVVLDVVGFDDWNGRVQRECEQLGLSRRVEFHGWKGQEELAAYFQRAHVFVMTSVDDVAPVAVLEAAAGGLPIVGTDVGYVADWAPEMAIRTPVRDPRALADALASLLSNRSERERLASRAQDWVCRHAALEANDAYATLYQELSADDTSSVDS